MCNDRLRHRRSTLKRQRGVSLILVLFLLVVVSLLAASMAQLNRGASNSVSMEIQSVRALFAAESGAQIAAMTIFPIGTSGSCVGSVTRTFTVPGLNNCSATVTCNGPVSVTVNSTTYNEYRVDSSGVCGNINTGDYARRKITVGLRN